MKIHISPRDGIPIYMQIVGQVKHLVAARRLTAGKELPSIRALAEQILVNPNTVARAYRELETAGILVSRRGSGTYVSDQGSPLARRERLKILNERIDALLAEAGQLDVDYDQLMEMVAKRNKAMQSGKKGERG